MAKFKFDPKKYKKHTFNKIVDRPNNFAFPAVYIVYPPTSDDVIYVGSTYSLAERIGQHMDPSCSKKSIGKILKNKRQHYLKAKYSCPVNYAEDINKQIARLSPNVGMYRCSYLQDDAYNWRQRYLREYELIGQFYPLLNVLKESDINF